MSDPRIEVVRNLREPGNYEKACLRESEVWGRFHSDQERDKRVARSQEAEIALGVDRARLKLPELLKKRNLVPRAGLSLACGNGRAERGLMKNGICERFDGIDISEQAIGVARKLASADALNIHYRTGDLNTLTLPAATYDLVVTQSCLHHVLELEHLAYEIWKSLRPGGVLWIHDFIGESQFQWTERRMEIAQHLFRLIPDELRWDDLNQRPHQPRRPVPGRLVSPFEAIRSEEVIPVFSSRFDVLEKSVEDGILQLVAHKGLYATFASSERGREVFESLWQIDRQLVESGTLPPLRGQFLMMKKTGAGLGVREFLTNLLRR